MQRTKQCSQPLFVDSSTIKLNPKNYYARLNEAVGDWQSLATPLLGAFSQGVGRPSDAVVYLKIFLIGYLENIIHDTDLAERIGDSLQLRQFLGYSLDEAPPDHSSISRVRGQIGRSCDLSQLLSAVVERCQQVGLVDGQVAAVDATLLPANASLSSLTRAPVAHSVGDYLRHCDKQQSPTDAAGSGEQEGGEGGEAQEDDSHPPEGGGRKGHWNRQVYSRTDPDARLARRPGKPRGLYYTVSHITDSVGKIILAAGVDHADRSEWDNALPLLDQARGLLAQQGQGLGYVIADSGYDVGKFHAAVEAVGAVPVTNYRPREMHKPSGYKLDDFEYDAQANTYTCPEGKLLRQRQINLRESRRRYLSSAEDCRLCPERVKCLKPGREQRTLSRTLFYESRERARLRLQDPKALAALSKRKGTAEGPFGHMKAYGGLSRVNCRGLLKVRVKAMFAAVAWNLVRLMNALKGTPRGRPQVITCPA